MYLIICSPFINKIEFYLIFLNATFTYNDVKYNLSNNTIHIEKEEVESVLM